MSNERIEELENQLRVLLAYAEVKYSKEDADANMTFEATRRLLNKDCDTGSENTSGKSAFCHSTSGCGDARLIQYAGIIGPIVCNNPEHHLKTNILQDWEWEEWYEFSAWAKEKIRYDDMYHSSRYFAGWMGRAAIACEREDDLIEQLQETDDLIDVIAVALSVPEEPIDTFDERLVAAAKYALSDQAKAEALKKVEILQHRLECTEDALRNAHAAMSDLTVAAMQLNSRKDEENS